MPFSTLIRDLRKELAQYLKVPEPTLRMMCGNRVLKRAEYSDLTIRDGLIPLGSEPLVVIKVRIIV
jgi:hypothetical protein